MTKKQNSANSAQAKRVINNSKKQAQCTGGAKVRNFDSVVADSTPSRRRASLAPSAPVSSVTDKAQRAQALNIGAPVGSCRPAVADDNERGAFVEWSRKNGGASFSAFLHEMSETGGGVGVYENSVQSAIETALNGRVGRVRIILDAIRAYLVREDGAKVGNLLADGFAAWVTPAGYFLLADGETEKENITLPKVGRAQAVTFERSKVRVSRRLCAYVAQDVPAAYNESGKLSGGCVELSNGGGVVCGSPRISGGVKITLWGKTPVIMSGAAAASKRVKNSFESWMSWLRYCYNNTSALNHAEIVEQYGAAAAVLTYANKKDSTVKKQRAQAVSKKTKQDASIGAALSSAVGVSSSDLSAKLANLTPEKLAALKAALA